MIRIYRKFERVMDHPNSQALHRYWDALRDGRDAPTRSEIDPRRIAGSLDSMFILETTDLGQIRFRLAGTALCDLLGMEARGMTAEAAMAPGHERQIGDLAARVLAGPQIGVMRVRTLDARGADWSGEMLLLPLRSELGELNRIIGCVGFDGANRRDRPQGPARLRCQGLRTLAIEPAEGAARDPLDLLGAPVARQAPRQAAPAGFGEAPAPFRRGPAAPAAAPATAPAPTSRPQLTAIEGNPRAPREAGPKRRPALRVVRDGETGED